MVIPLQEFILSHIAEVVIGVIIGVGIAILTRSYERLDKKIKEKDERTEASNKGIRALLHHQLYSDCQRLIKEGCVTSEELCDIEQIYESYHALGGNGTGTALYKRIQSLPIVVDNRKDDSIDA